MRRLSYTRWSEWQGFPNLFSLGETAMPSLRSAAVGKLLLCTKSTTCFTNPAKPRTCCRRGSLATSPFNFLHAPCFVGCLFRSISVRWTIVLRSAVTPFPRLVAPLFVVSKILAVKRKRIWKSMNRLPTNRSKGIVRILGSIHPCSLSSPYVVARVTQQDGKEVWPSCPFVPLNFQTY